MKLLNKLVKDLTGALKKVKRNDCLMLVAAAVLAYMVYHYSTGKSITLDGMTENASSDEKADAASASPQPYGMATIPPAVPGPQAAQPLGENEDFASAQGVASNTQGLPPSCSRQPVANPAELLPKGSNNQFSQLNPMGEGDLKNVNLLKAGHHIGINTVGQSPRNANLQVRSEPANPQMNVGPWMNTTIEPDTMRTPLEIGQGPQ